MKKILSGIIVSVVVMSNVHVLYAINDEILVGKFIRLGFGDLDARYLLETGCDYDYCKDFLLKTFPWKEKIKCYDIQMFYEYDFSVDEAVNTCRVVLDNCREGNLNRLYELIRSGFTKYDILRFSQENSIVGLDLLFDLSGIEFKKDDLYKLLSRCEKGLSVETIKILVNSGITIKNFLNLLKSDFDTGTVNKFLENGASSEVVGICAEKFKKEFVDWAVPQKLNVKSIAELAQRNFSEKVIKILIEKNFDLNQRYWQNSQVSGECVEKLMILEKADLIYLVINLSNSECTCLLKGLDQKQYLEKFIELMRKYGVENVKILLNQNFSWKVFNQITKCIDKFAKDYDIELIDILKCLESGLDFEDIEIRFGILQTVREAQRLDLRHKFFKKSQISWRSKFANVEMDENEIKERIRDLAPDSKFENFLFTEWYDDSGTRFERMNLDAKQLLRSVLAAKEEIKQNQECLLSIQSLFGDYQDACPNRGIDIIASAARALDEYLGCDNLTEYILQLFRNEAWEGVINSGRQDKYSKIRDGFWNGTFGAENRLVYGYVVRNAWGINAPAPTEFGYINPNKEFIKDALAEEISVEKIEEHFKAVLKTEEHIFLKALEFYDFNLNEYALIKNLDKDYLKRTLESFIDTLKLQDEKEEWKQTVEEQFGDIIRFCNGDCFKLEEISSRINQLFDFYKSYDEKVDSFENIESYFKSFSRDGDKIQERISNRMDRDEIVEILCEKYVRALRDEEYTLDY